MQCLPEVGDTYKQCEDKATPLKSPVLLIEKKKKGIVKTLNMLLIFLSKG